MKKICAILIIFFICAIGKTATDSNNTIVPDSNNTAVSDTDTNTTAGCQEKIKKLERVIESQQKTIEKQKDELIYLRKLCSEAGIQVIPKDQRKTTDGKDQQQDIRLTRPDTVETPKTNKVIEDVNKTSQIPRRKEEILEIRAPSKKARQVVTVLNGNALYGIKGIAIRTGPGMNYKQDDTGELDEDEKLYVLEEKDGWIRFRVTPKDVGWSAWIKKDLTDYFSPSPEQIDAERIAKFGEPPKNSEWDGSVKCVKDYLESVAKDPDSLKYEKWSQVFSSDDGWLVQCDFRAKNSFGAYERYVKWFVIRNGFVVDAKDGNAYR